MKLIIDLKETVQANTERIMQSFLQECRASLQQEDPHKAIHEVRKTMKKMRAFSRLMRGEISKKAYRKTNTFYRDVARQIAEARDITAMLETLKNLHDSLDIELCGQALQDIKNHLVARKSAISRVQINTDKLLENILEDLQKGEAVLAKWKVENDNFSAFSQGIERTYKQCKQAMKKAYKKKSTSNFHAWRKSSKYLRYEVDFLRAIWPAPMKTLENELHQLTDFLGEDHDLAVLKNYMQEMDYERGPALDAIFTVMDQRREELHQLAKPLGKRLLCEPPKQFVDRLESYWKQSLKVLERKENSLV